jgi:aminopeptidase N
LLLPAVAAASPSGTGDPYFPLQGNGGFDVRRYDVTLDVNPSTSNVVADVRIVSRSKRRLKSFHLDFVGPKPSVIEVNGKEATWTRNGPELIVRPTKAIVRNRRFVTEVAYAGKPPSVTDHDGSTEGWIQTSDGTAALGEPRGTPAWIPCNNHPTDKAKFSFRVTVPSTHVAIANGDLISEISANGDTTYFWRERKPMATYLATLSTGLYDLEESQIAGIPAWTAIDTTLLLTTDLTVTPQIHEYFGDTFGEYPFTSTGAIVDSAPTLGYALETQSRPYYSFPPNASLIVHELAHQWYGDSVSPHRWREIWLNEGFATYAEWIWDEHSGDDSAQQHFDDEYAKPANDDFWQLKIGNPGRKNLFDPAVYERGGMTLHALRLRIGDGDFFQLLKRWAAKYRYSDATTKQLIRMAENISGEGLDKLFRDWLYTAGKPPAP